MVCYFRNAGKNSIHPTNFPKDILVYVSSGWVNIFTEMAHCVCKIGDNEMCG